MKATCFRNRIQLSPWSCLHVSYPPTAMRLVPFVSAFALITNALESDALGRPSTQPSSPTFRFVSQNSGQSVEQTDILSSVPMSHSHPFSSSDLYVRHEQLPYFAHRNSSCLIFSCSRRNYPLLGSSLAANSRTNKHCDRAHFFVRTFATSAGKPVASHWCRVALLNHRPDIFDQYRTVAYVDVDVIYSERGILAAAESERPFSISSKVKRGKTEIRTCWFVIRDVKDMRTKRMLSAWAENWKNVRLQDQTVFNELFDCDFVDCVDESERRTIELKHCGSGLDMHQRMMCLLEGPRK